MPATIALIRKTALVTPSQVMKLAAALQVQVSRDFAPTWGSDPRIVAGARKGAWPVYIQDSLDVSGALGYHFTSNGRADGSPFGRVGVALDRQYGLSWTVTTSHEVLEMLADPTCGSAYPYPPTPSMPAGGSVSGEVCDAVEADSLGYLINGIRVSNFVLPSFFTGDPTKPGRFDFRGVLKAPLTLAHGGYMAVLDHATNKWTQVTQQAEQGVTSRASLSARAKGI